MCVALVVRDTEETSQPDLKLWVEDRWTDSIMSSHALIWTQSVQRYHQ